MGYIQPRGIAGELAMKNCIKPSKEVGDTFEVEIIFPAERTTHGGNKYNKQTKTKQVINVPANLDQAV